MPRSSEICSRTSLLGNRGVMLSSSGVRAETDTPAPTNGMISWSGVPGKSFFAMSGYRICLPVQVSNTRYSISPAEPSGRPHCFRSEEHTSELQSLRHLVCRLLLEKKKNTYQT